MNLFLFSVTSGFRLCVPSASISALLGLSATCGVETKQETHEAGFFVFELTEV